MESSRAVSRHCRKTMEFVDDDDDDDDDDDGAERGEGGRGAGGRGAETVRKAGVTEVGWRLERLFWHSLSAEVAALLLGSG